MDVTDNIGDAVKELHADLRRKYQIHAAKLETAWRSFDKAQRTRCIRAGAADGVVLKHNLDISLGSVYKFLPEWNLRDITEPGSDFLLDLLKHRATTTLEQQYINGPNDGPGDHEYIVEMMQKKNLRHVAEFKDCYTFFLDKYYGQSFHFVREKQATLAQFAPAVRARLLIPQSTGQLILQRQLHLLQVLNIMIEDILDIGSQTRNRKQMPKKDTDFGPIEAFSSLSVKDAPGKVQLSEVVAGARDRKAALEERVELLSAEPVVLAHAVNDVFFSRPELLPDEKGRSLPVHTDRYINAAFFDAVHGEIQAAAIWAYITRLVELLEVPNSEKAYRALVLQELSNVCHMEYERSQNLLKRHLATADGPKRFKRISNAYDKAGNARLSMKCKPEELMIADPQLHYLLRLCQSETTAAKAIDWMKKLGDLYMTRPSERERIEERQAEAFFALAVITGFVQDLSSAVSLPAPSRKKGQAFLQKSQQLECELAPLKKEIDLRDYAAPIDHLLEPGMAESALGAFESFIVDNAGTKMGFLYQDIITDCLAHLQDQYEQAKSQKEKDDKIQQEKDSQATPFPFFTTEEPKEVRIERRREKTKTRPSQASAYELAPRDEPPIGQPQSAQSKEIIKVSAPTGEVFDTLFNKSKARGSISWTSFEAAMAELGFSVFPKYGSVYTFRPPSHSTEAKPFTIHRPHGASIDGYKILILARRLKRTYGWGEETFVID
ncbi:hypothetical protein CkaCkLH20_08978 [Colletotrichum karsti]|uniref:Ipa protein n=1 Tax=Colletotrichum karsti TaxID=1095194 RepID=A0A9P6HZW9_9PEZI|nr:uncharacterized protein CkaCkLH20_08978 [Colletotrichum karsti]KAF9873519.1 hypothetical protein CkaCkLH20_08978 [Colletotrichum karsti]